MPNTLLREYVTLMVEKIRTAKGDKGKFGDKFNMSRFKAIDNLETLMVYANHFLDVLGEGSSRRAYLLSGKYVLKIARNEKGLAQNEAELDVYTNPKSKPIVAKIYGSDPKHRWLIADVVKPIKDPNEFHQLTGIEWEKFCRYVAEGVKYKSVPKEAPEFVKRVVLTALENRMLRGDMVDLLDDMKTGDKSIIDHWGKTPDGRAVLLDYGFTHEVWSNHYQSQPQPTPGHDDKTRGPGKATDTEKNKVDAFGKTARDNRNLGHAKTEPAKPSGTTDRKASSQDAKTVAPQKRQQRPEEDPQDAKTVAPKKRLA